MTMTTKFTTLETPVDLDEEGAMAIVSLQDVPEEEQDAFLITYDFLDTDDEEFFCEVPLYEAEEKGYTISWIEDFREDVMLNYMRSADHYLVYADGVTWDGQKGYKLSSSLDDTYYRSYDCHFTIVGYSDAYVKMIEYSHDVPTGCPVYVFALTDEDYQKIDYCGWEEVEKYLKKKKIGE